MPFTQQVPTIEGGCHYALQIAVSCNGAGPFPTSSALRAKLRDYESAATIATISTVDGSLYLIDDQTVELQLPAAITAKLQNTSALVEFIVGEVDPEAIGISIRLPVVPVNRAVLGSSTAIVMSLYDMTLSRCAARTVASTSPPAPTPDPTLATVRSDSPARSDSVPGFMAAAAALASRLNVLGA